MALLITCHKHPKYLAMRRPSSTCLVCLVMWECAQRLRMFHKGWQMRYFRRPQAIRTT